MSSTHALYAKHVAEHILLVYGVKLKRYSLIYGAIKPDVSTIFAKYPHYINASLDNLCDTVEMLIENIEGKKELESRAFARELGVILHYIADYFCRVHNNVNGKKHLKNMKHIWYEKSLHKVIKKYELEHLREDATNDLEYDLKKIDMISFEDYIIYKHNRYMKDAGKLYLHDNNKRRKQTDIKYSYKMELLIASYIVKKIKDKTKLLRKVKHKLTL